MPIARTFRLVYLQVQPVYYRVGLPRRIGVNQGALAALSGAAHDTVVAHHACFGHFEQQPVNSLLDVLPAYLEKWGT